MNDQLKALEKKAPVYLYAPRAFWKAPLRVIEMATGGCGSGRIGDWLVPDKMYGMSIFYACRIHDWMYKYGATLEEKKQADRVFLNNMIRLISKHTRSRVLMWLRRRRALKYYVSVKMFGGPAYWKGKEDSPNSQLRVKVEVSK